MSRVQQQHTAQCLPMQRLMVDQPGVRHEARCGVHFHQIIPMRGEPQLASDLEPHSAELDSHCDHSHDWPAKAYTMKHWQSLLGASSQPPPKAGDCLCMATSEDSLKNINHRMDCTIDLYTVGTF